MHVLFLHGLESSPGGTKAQELEGAGHTVLNPALPRDSFDESVRIAQEQVDAEAPDYIVGSSRGGAVAMVLKNRGARLVLVAPAWRAFGVAPKVPSDTVILHSDRDDLVPLDDSIELAEANGAELELCGECHRMSDEEALSVWRHYVGR